MRHNARQRACNWWEITALSDITYSSWQVTNDCTSELIEIPPLISDTGITETRSRWFNETSSCLEHRREKHAHMWTFDLSKTNRKRSFLRLDFIQFFFHLQAVLQSCLYLWDISQWEHLHTLKMLQDLNSRIDNARKRKRRLLPTSDISRQ
jgi:hypothetical protein